MKHNVKKKKQAAEAGIAHGPADSGVGANSAGGNARGPKKVLDKIELQALVCRKFVEGKKATDIRKEINACYANRITREIPYRLIARAAARGWIRYTPPSHIVLEKQIRDAYPTLKGVDVVHAATIDDVTECGARALLRILQQNYAKREVHIGFSGGHAMREVARHLAQLLREPTPALPSKIVFHALVSGFDLRDPTSDASTFFTYFVGDPGLQIKPEFVGLHAPPFISAKQLDEFVKLEPIQEALKEAARVNVIVTSASQVTDEHNALRRYMHMSEEALRKANCVGDILWQPIGPGGPVRLASDFRALTLVDLRGLQAFAADTLRQVLLVAGPCGVCNVSKGEIVKAILNQERPLITHLVTDSACARSLFQRTA